MVRYQTSRMVIILQIKIITSIDEGITYKTFKITDQVGMMTHLQ
jgi:hypothetical protein